jgi:Spore coat protein CotO
MSVNKSREPLLYIQQPEIAFPKTEMQHTYVVRKAELESENTVLKPLADRESKLNKTVESNDNNHKHDHGIQSNEEETKVNSLSNTVMDEGELQSKIQNEELPTSSIQDAIHQYNKQDQKEAPSSNPTRKKQSYSFNRVKSFKEMNTVERLNYLVHFPKLLPPVPCVFVTKSRSVKGFLVNKTEDAIEIKQFNDQMMQISIGELIEVKMIGLK